MKYRSSAWLGLSGLLLVASAKGDDANLHQTCQSHLHDCLQLIESDYQQLETGSHLWLQVQSYQMDALYQLGDLKQMLTLTTSLVQAPNLPAGFQLTAHIYHAKMLEFFGKRRQALEFIDKSITIFKGLKGHYSAPIRLVQLANLQLLAASVKLKENQLDQYKQKLNEAEQLLLEIESKFKNDQTAEFRHELYTNFGHVYRRLGNGEKTISSFEKALFWYKQTDNIQQISVGYYNVARGYQAYNQPEKAISVFEKAAVHAKQAKDEQLLVYSYLRIMQMALQINDAVTVEKMRTKLTDKHFNRDHQRLYDEITQSMN